MKFMKKTTRTDTERPPLESPYRGAHTSKKHAAESETDIFAVLLPNTASTRNTCGEDRPTTAKLVPSVSGALVVEQPPADTVVSPGNHQPLQQPTEAVVAYPFGAAVQRKL